MEDVHSPHPPQQPAPDPTTASTPQPQPQPPAAHSLIRLIQCPQCSLPLRTPLRLPCGNTICRACLPPTRTRPRITYPASEGREQGFECYYWARAGPEECVGEHCVGDCGVDVLMTGLVGVFDEVLGGPSTAAGARVTWREDQDEDAAWRDEVLQSGRLQGVYGLVKNGRIGYDASEVRYHDGPAEEGEDAEGAAFAKLAERIQNELDCHVCYSLILDPLTTPCGHTFCRRCVAGVLGHSDLCPVCRRKLSMLSNLQAEPTNKRVAGLIESLFPDQVAARREALPHDELDFEEGTVPLFVCTLSFPGMPTFLHVYERRYRIMMLRALASGTRRFGMVAYNHGNRPQGNMGRAPFLQYGTLLRIERFDTLRDGRCLVIARGISRFRVTKSEMQEGYHVGRTERIDDVSLAEEEALESREVSNAARAAPSLEEHLGQSPLESMSTQELFELGRNFVQKQSSAGSGWLHPRALMAYGNLPTDPAQFPWWLASVLPVPEEEKYALLSTTSVRARLKITARWIRTLEARRWCVYL
jgi:Lon protease-like protein